jgi:hypothetical protein
VGIHLLAFGFGNALMLGWLGAASAPILIHLWNRRRFREVPWAAMEYLLAALRKNSRRMQLEQWLLLAIRTLIVVLVVLAMARPLTDTLGITAAESRTFKILVVDSSYSMDQITGGETHFALAKKRAADIVTSSRAGDAFALVALASPPTVVVSQPTVEAKAVLDEITALKLMHTSADLPATLAQVEKLAAQGRGKGLPNCEVTIFSDLALNTWSQVQGTATGEFGKDLKRLADAAKLTVVEIGSAETDNLAITQLSLTSPLVTTDTPAEITAEVRSFTPQPREGVRVELLVDGQEITDQRIEIPAQGSSSVHFEHRFDVPGEHGVEVRLPKDSLGVDNHRFLAVQARDGVRVLCVDGKPGGALQGAADHIALALNPSADGRSTGRIRPLIATEDSLLERPLGQYEILILSNISQPSAAEASALTRFVEQGGGLIVFLGGQTNVARFNQQLVEGPTRLLPMKLLEPAAAKESGLRIDPLGYRHPILKEFAGHEDSGLQTVLVHHYFRLGPIPKSEARVVLALENGDPLVVEEPRGQGRVILIATEGSLSTRDPQDKQLWSNLALNPAFPALVQESLQFAMTGQRSSRNVRVGQPLGEAMSPHNVGASLTVQTPSGPQTILTKSDEQNPHWSYADTLESGLYRVSAAGEGDEVFAVNLDTSESVPTRVPSSELAPELGGARPNSGSPRELAAANVPRGFHRPLLLATLALLLLETWLARRIGSPHR